MSKKCKQPVFACLTDPGSGRLPSVYFIFSLLHDHMDEQFPCGIPSKNDCLVLENVGIPLLNVNGIVLPVF